MRININSEAISSDIVRSQFQEISENMQKSIMQLKSGDKFGGLITDIKPESVSVKLSDGSVLNAKTAGMTDLRIGEQAEFVVKNNESGKITVEIAKGSSESKINSIVGEALKNAELPLTKDNVDIVKMLIQNNMPIDKQTVEKAMFFKYQIQNGDNINNAAASNIAEKILFLLNEEFPAVENSVSVLNKIVDSNNGFKNSVLNMVDSIFEMKDGEIKSQLLKLIGFDENSIENISKNSVRHLIKNKFFINSGDSEEIKNISEKFLEIRRIVENAEKFVSENTELTALKENFENIKNDIDFMKHINSYKEFIQIPLNVNGSFENGELYVFKDGKRKNISPKNAAVLLSIDYPSFGRIETFIEKNDKQLLFQFRFQNDEFISLFKKNINSLSNMLERKGFNISSVMYKSIEEPFNVAKNIKNTNAKNTLKRYSFDMRV